MHDNTPLIELMIKCFMDSFHVVLALAVNANTSSRGFVCTQAHLIMDSGFYFYIQRSLPEKLKCLGKK